MIVMITIVDRVMRRVRIACSSRMGSVFHHPHEAARARVGGESESEDSNLMNRLVRGGW